MLVSMFMQVANSGWVLGVQIRSFESIINAEIRNGIYCCCDIPQPCEANVASLQSSDCSIECSPYIDVYLQVCYLNDTCSSYSPKGSLTLDNFLITSISPLLIPPNFQQTILDNINYVSTETVDTHTHTNTHQIKQSFTLNIS